MYVIVGRKKIETLKTMNTFIITMEICVNVCFDVILVWGISMKRELFRLLYNTEYTRL